MTMKILFPYFLLKPFQYQKSKWATNIFILFLPSRQIGQLQQIARAQRSQGLQGRHQQSHSSSVVVALQSKLASMTSSFKDVLEVRTENLKESRTRQEMFSQVRNAIASSK